MKTTHKYIEIKNYILDNIRTGRYLAGEKIESENSLMEKFKVSRMTVRQAIIELQNENVIVSSKGKGTYVQLDDINTSGAFLTSFSENMLVEGKIPTSKIISFSQVMSSDELNEIFDFTISEPLWFFKRIRYSNLLPAIYEESYLPVKYAPSLNLSNLDHSLFQYLEDNHIIIHNAVQKTEATLPSAEIAEYLELTDHQPLVKVIQRCYDNKINCIEFSDLYYHPTNYINTKSVLRKKIETKAIQTKINLLFACDNGMITSIIEQKVKDVIQKDNLLVKTSLIELNRIDQVIQSYDIILLDPRFRFVLGKLVKAYPDKCIIVIDMQDYAKMDARKIILDALNTYKTTQK